jgi:chemotaxis regulatin CheY-phosphate phosphatase CheZ
MNSPQSDNGGPRHADPGNDMTSHLLQEHQQEWEAFAARAVQIIPALKAQMNAVACETERAAMELAVNLRMLSASDGMTTPHERAASLSKVVMAMQFQDMTRQKLEHVCLALDQLKCHLQVLLRGPLDDEAKKEIAVLLQVEQLYTMEEERRLHEATIQPDYEEPVPSDLIEGDTDSVTLFE